MGEWYRYLAERGLPAVHAVPHDHHIWQVEMEVANLSDGDRLARVGLGLPLPRRATWPPFQDVGEQLWREGWAGLLAPSAARANHTILCVFTGDWPPAGCQPIRSVEISEVPARPSDVIDTISD